MFWIFTVLPYLFRQYVYEWRFQGQKQKLSLRMKGLKRKDVKYKPRQGYYPEKDANRLINYMKIAAERQEKANIPVEERTYTNVFDKNKKFVGFIDPGSFYGHNEFEVSYLRWFDPKFMDRNFLDRYNDHISIDKYYINYEPIYQLYYSLLNVYLWDRRYVEDVRRLLDKIKI